MLDSLQVGLPISYILVVKAVDDVFAQDEIGLIDIRLVPDQARRNQICLVYCTALLAAPYRAQNFFSKPYEVSLEKRKHRSGGKISRQRLVTMQQMLGMRCDKNVNGIKQPLEIAFLYKKGAEGGHDENANRNPTLMRT